MSSYLSQYINENTKPARTTITHVQGIKGRELAQSLAGMRDIDDDDLEELLNPSGLSQDEVDDYGESYLYDDENTKYYVDIYNIYRDNLFSGPGRTEPENLIGVTISALDGTFSSERLYFGLKRLVYHLARSGQIRISRRRTDMQLDPEKARYNYYIDDKSYKKNNIAKKSTLVPNSWGKRIVSITRSANKQWHQDEEERLRKTASDAAKDKTKDKTQVEKPKDDSAKAKDKTQVEKPKDDSFVGPTNDRTELTPANKEDVKRAGATMKRVGAMDIATIQNTLKAYFPENSRTWGTLLEQIQPDGKWGEETYNAIRGFQKDIKTLIQKGKLNSNNLVLPSGKELEEFKTDGIFGKDTMQAMISAEKADLFKTQGKIKVNAKAKPAAAATKTGAVKTKKDPMKMGVLEYAKSQGEENWYRGKILKIIDTAFENMVKDEIAIEDRYASKNPTDIPAEYLRDPIGDFDHTKLNLKQKQKYDQGYNLHIKTFNTLPLEKWSERLKSHGPPNQPPVPNFKREMEISIKNWKMAIEDSAVDMMTAIRRRGAGSGVRRAVDGIYKFKDRKNKQKETPVNPTADASQKHVEDAITKDVAGQQARVDATIQQTTMQQTDESKAYAYLEKLINEELDKLLG